MKPPESIFPSRHAIQSNEQQQSLFLFKMKVLFQDETQNGVVTAITTMEFQAAPELQAVICLLFPVVGYLLAGKHSEWHPCCLKRGTMP